jgi:hypothetical protein
MGMVTLDNAQALELVPAFGLLVAALGAGYAGKNGGNDAGTD